MVLNVKKHCWYG